MQSYGHEFSPSYVAAVAAWMACWWVTEAVSIEITALLPIILIPFAGLHEKNALAEACIPYADRNVFFFLGGFGLGLGIEKTGLHRIGSMYLLKLAGSNAVLVIGAFMLTTALISMWVSNTATTMLMIPLAMSVIAIQKEREFAAPLLIGVSYAASIGGMTTLVGTAPNIFFAGFMAREGKTIEFMEWLSVAGPIAVILLLATWVWLTCVLFPVRGKQVAIPEDWKKEFEESRGFTLEQKVTLGIFAITAGTWMTRGFLMRAAESMNLPNIAATLRMIEDPWVAMLALVLLLLVPFGKPVLAWKDVEGAPWGVLILMGGGLSLAKAIEESGLDVMIGNLASNFVGLSPWLVLTLVMVIIIAISEFASNTATATAMIPILSGAGPALGIDQLTLLSTVVLASSCGFMLPVATPPNTLVYAQRKFPASDMMKAGAMVNLLAAIVIPIVILQLRPWLGN